MPNLGREDRRVAPDETRLGVVALGSGPRGGRGATNDQGYCPGIAIAGLAIESSTFSPREDTGGGLSCPHGRRGADGAYQERGGRLISRDCPT